MVLLHGFPDFWWSWRFQIPALAAAGFHVIAPDMRGYNLSEKPSATSSYTVDRLALDIAELIDQLGPQRAHVVGHDWGGIVAWELAMSHPDLVDRLAVLNVPHPSRYRDGTRMPRQWLKSWYIVFFQVPGLAEWVFKVGDLAAFGRFLQSSPRTFDEEDVERYLEAARRSDGMRYPIKYYRPLLPRTLFGRPGGLNVIDHPTIVIWGDRDVALEPSLAEPDPRWVPNATVHHLPDANHWVHRSAREEVNDLLLDFLG